MLYRIFQIFIDSFKVLYRERLNFYISSFTISICLVLVSLVFIFSTSSIKKIQGIQIPELIVSYSKTLDDNCMDVCYYDNEQCPECSVYIPSKLELKGTDSKSDKNGKIECKQCLDRNGFSVNAKFFTLTCEEECTPNNNSEYSKYYGSKKRSKCGECLDRECDRANNEIMQIKGISRKTKTVYKEDALMIWESLSGEPYFNRKHVDYIDFPMHGEFMISDEIDDKESLYGLIDEVKEYGFVEDVNDEDMIDVANFFFYKKLISVIISAALVLILVALLIPFSIVSNTIHLIIYSKRQILHTLKILGEKDFFIKLPFIFQGIWQGVIGSFMALLFIYFLDILDLGNIVGEFLNTAIKSSNEIKISLIYSLKHIFIILLLGIVLGVVGALRSISKYIK